jgi:hypothetical protein
MRWKLASTALLLGLALPVLAQSLGFDNNSNQGTNKKQLTPGSDTHFKWSSKEFNDARDVGKPIAIYVFDPAGRLNPAAEFLEGEVFSNANVQAAFADFLMVKLSVGDKWWPEQLLQPGRNNAALLILTCDTNLIACFSRQNLPKLVKDKQKGDTYPELIAAAEKARAANPVALERMKKSPPPKFVPTAINGPGAADKDLLTKDEKAEKAKEKAKEENLVPGLKDKKADPEKKDIACGKGKKEEKKPKPSADKEDNEYPVRRPPASQPELPVFLGTPFLAN